ncbi:MAG: GatB/YqeY domain-containing protein [Bacteroidetes bacterium]|nr:GatB/YqeY domain-containing protein [Bacteroidota bacterium]MDA0903355.1 GatB/YqeY domain-containing protein [Bacteroidota bacterium]MDA1242321.1 GatB/YqeY domain-containing protein [Bacteroidota bacterium]
MGNLAQAISEGIKDAMRAKDRDRLAALRDIKSKILLESTKEGGQSDVDDATTMAILSKLVKQRNETAALYREQGRPDLAEEEEAQAKVIQEFLPAALTDAEIEGKVKEIIASTGASSMADMGKVMGLASAAMAGQADGKVISQFVRNILSS